MPHIIFIQSEITPLKVACSFSSWDVVDELVSRGATVSGEDNVSYVTECRIHECKSCTININPVHMLYTCESESKLQLGRSNKCDCFYKCFGDEYRYKKLYKFLFMNVVL